MNAQRIGRVVFAILGLGLWTTGGLVARASASLRDRGVAVDGTVVSVTDHRSPDGTMSYRATIVWTAPDGRSREWVRYANSLGAYARGAHVRLLYDPQHPAEPGSADFTSRWMGAGLLLAMGAVFLTIASKRPRSAELRQTGE